MKSFTPIKWLKAHGRNLAFATVEVRLAQKGEK